MTNFASLRNLCILSSFFAVSHGPELALASSTPRDVANKVLAQVKAGLPSLLKGTNPMSDASNVPILEDMQSIAFDSLDDLPQKMPYPPDKALLDQVSSDFGDQSIGNDPMSWSPDANLGGVMVTEGTAECNYWDLFSASGGHTHLAPTPAVLSQSLCDESGQWGGLSHVGTYGVAISVDSPEDDLENGGPGSSATLTVAVQVWDGRTWTPPEQLQATLSYPLDPQPYYKYCVSGRCRDAEKLAFRMAGQFEASRQADFKPFRLSGADVKTFAGMLDMIQDGNEDTLPTAPASDDSANASDPDGGDWDFGDASRVFAANLDGALVIGRIGHGQLAWREDPDWSIAFWSLDPDGTELDPVAGFIFQHSGPYLRSVVIGTNWSPDN